MSTKALCAAIAVLWSCAPAAQSVVVRHTEGVVHGFLVLRAANGAPLADGDLMQSANGDRVTSTLIFHFRDGSVQEETAVFAQHQRFQLITDHLVQKGPTFPRPLEMSIDRAAGKVTVRDSDEHGAPKVADERIDLPLDLANGLIPTLLKNVGAADLPLTVSMIAATPTPRLVKLHITSVGEERFSLGASTRNATHYVVKIDIGGVAGLLAPLLGKQPPDSHVWILGGEEAAFVKAEGPSYLSGPVWRTELASPIWPQSQAAAR
jgi:hypothetical protein